MADPKPSWDLHKTPKPSERSFSVTIPNPEVAENTTALDAFVVGSLFKNFPLIPEQRLAAEDQFGNYKFVDCLGTGNASMQFLFVRTKTDKERATPFRIREITERKEWAAVLEWIQFGKETGFPLSQNTINGQGRQAIVTADRWLVPRGYLPAQFLQSRITIKEYLSDVPFPEWAMESDEPQPTEVMWDLVGSHGTMGKVLHPTVTVPAQSTAGYRVVTTAGDVQAANSSAQKTFVFPNTNHKKRRDYTINVIEFVGGQYYRQEILIHTPNPAKIVQEV